MRQAYLIVTHNEYDVLQELVSALDSKDIDIYIHVDKKTKALPKLKAKQSNINILQNRIKVYWGHFSLVEAEILLLEAAYNAKLPYEYFHIISGIHYPIRPISEINAFYASVRGQNVIQTMPEEQATYIKRLGKYHFFMKNYTSNMTLQRAIMQIWRILLFIQKLLGIQRDISYYGGKSSNWCSITNETVGLWLADKDKLKKRFRYTYCSDEYVFLSIIREHKLPYIEYDKLLFQKFENGNPKSFTWGDYELLVNSGAFWGRKFTKESIPLIRKIQMKQSK